MMSPTARRAPAHGASQRPDGRSASEPARAEGAGARGKAATVDDYLAGLAPDQRAALERLRRSIRAAAPDAEECISYGLPAFRQGRVLVGFGAAAKHCALYLFSDATVAAHQDDLARYATSKGAVRFPPGAPLPATLVRKLVKARLAENASSDARRGAGAGDRKPASPPRARAGARPAGPSVGVRNNAPATRSF